MRRPRGAVEDEPSTARCGPPAHVEVRGCRHREFEEGGGLLPTHVGTVAGAVRGGRRQGQGFFTKGNRNLYRGYRSYRCGSVI
jgi:hypothetical protein